MCVRHWRGLEYDRLISLNSTLRRWRRWSVSVRGRVKLNGLVNLDWRLGTHQDRRLDWGGSECAISRRKASRRSRTLHS